MLYFNKNSKTKPERIFEFANIKSYLYDINSGDFYFVYSEQEYRFKVLNQDEHLNEKIESLFAEFKVQKEKIENKYNSNLIVQKQIEYYFSKNEDEKLQKNQFYENILNKIPQELQNLNCNFSNCYWMSYEKNDENLDFLNDEAVFTFEQQTYISKNKIQPQQFWFLVISQYPIKFEREKSSDYFFNLQYYLESSLLPGLIDFQNIYFIQKNYFNQLNYVYKMIPVNNIQKVGFVDYQQDFLPGYNIYIQTKNHLHIIGTQTATEAINWIESLNNIQKYYEILSKYNLQLYQRPSYQMYESFDNFKVKEFLIKNRQILIDFKINGKFDIDKFETCMKNFQKFIKMIKTSQRIFDKVQKFIYNYHLHIVQQFNNTSVKLKFEQLSQFYKLICNYDYTLKKYEIYDLELKNSLIQINNTMFEQLVSQILILCKGVIIKHLQGDQKINFWQDIFQQIFENEHIKFQKFKFSYEIFIRILQTIIESLERVIVFDQKLNQDIYINILTSTENFKYVFKENFQKYQKTHFDKNFIRKLQQNQINSIYDELKELYRTFINEIEKEYERQIQLFFYQSKSLMDCDLNILFNENFLNRFINLKKKISFYLIFQVYENVLQFFMEYYIMKLFQDLVNDISTRDMMKKIEQDQLKLISFFSPFIQSENLNVFVKPFELVKILLFSNNYHNLTSSIIKLNIYFCNRLTTEIVVAILMKNFNVSFKVEELILSTFNQSRRDKEVLINSQLSKFDENQSKSSIIYNSTSQINYKKNSILPFLSQNLALKIKQKSFNLMIKKISNQQNQNQDQFNSFELVNHETCEKNLENFVKILYFYGENFSEQKLVQQLKNGNYQKFKSKVIDNILYLYNIENYEICFAVNIKYIQKVQKFKDLVLIFCYNSYTYLWILPTKIERNLWYFSLKNMKKLQNLVNFEELKQIKCKELKINYKHDDLYKIEIDLPIENNKNTFEIDKYYSIKNLHDYISKKNRMNLQRSRAKSIEIQELKEQDNNINNTLQSQTSSSHDLSEQLEQQINQIEQSSEQIDQQQALKTEVQSVLQVIKYQQFIFLSKLELHIASNLKLQFGQCQ